jgi:hypothetical protein
MSVIPAIIPVGGLKSQASLRKKHKALSEKQTKTISSWVVGQVVKHCLASMRPWVQTPVKKQEEKKREEEEEGEKDKQRNQKREIKLNT